MNKDIFQSAKTLVIKVGSSLVTKNGEGIDLDALSMWAKQIAEIRALGKDVILVSSGAIAEGIKRIGWSVRPKALHELQAAAAVGQMGLAQAYESCFRQFEIGTAQILLTHEDLADRKRYLNAKSTLKTLLRYNIIPIINENDTVVTDEIRFGDNDTLGALVTNLVEGDIFIILTDQEGLYTADPRHNPDATLIQQDDATNPDLLSMAGGAGSSVGTGGMQSKVVAARRASNSGAHTVIASGREENVLVRLCQGEIVGTQLLSSQDNILNARKQWLADHLQIKGKLVLDKGAVKALSQEGKSLLPVGVCAVLGSFERGEIVSCIDEHQQEIARGLVNYNAFEVQKIMRKPSSDIEHLLGYIDEDELIHRDNLVILNI